MRAVIIALVLLIATTCVLGQQIGSYTAEKHPTFPVQQCTNSTGCKALNTSVVLDANWRWLHKVNDYTNCFTGSEWDKTICSSPTACAQNCALEGADYDGTYGVKVSGNSLSITLVTRGEYSTNVGARVYLLASDTSYYLFKLKNQEFTFDVDVSNLPCGLNGALYTTEMAADGGMSKYPTNKAGARYGTGYCDAQCPHDMKFINGEANLINWEASPDDPNSGAGLYGTCCTEMDLWEANSMATAYTPHLCSVVGQTRCNGTTCGDGADRLKGYCDKSGCDFNSYRMGKPDFYGKGKTVDTSKPFTVTTRWITDNGQASGNLVEIRRVYKQNGKVIANSEVNVSGMKNYVSITDQYCKEETGAFQDQDYFESLGGLTGLGQSLERGHVLSLSLWDDHAAHMLWLDSAYPLDVPASNPGITRGPCATSTGVPAEVEQQTPGAHVIFSNIRFGELGSTTN